MSKVKRSTYQICAEENKRLKKDIETLVMRDDLDKAKEVFVRWHEHFTANRRFNSIMKDIAKDYFKEHPEFVRESLGMLKIVDVNAMTIKLYGAKDKMELLQRLSEQYGPVAMIGDGVNDAPALAIADIGIAMGAAGSDVALESADVVLMGDDLSHLPYIFNLSRKTRRVLAFNLSFALFMIAVMIGGIFIFSLPLPLAVLGHEGGTVLVSLNGLRLLGYRDKSAGSTRRVVDGEVVATAVGPVH